MMAEPSDKCVRVCGEGQNIKLLRALEIVPEAIPGLPVEREAPELACCTVLTTAPPLSKHHKHAEVPQP